MATLVLTTIGGAIGGPIGAMLGGLIGQAADREFLFTPKGREGPRLTELAIQTSSYGTPIPKLFGTLRVAGSVIWATDLVEHRNREGGGKGQPSVTTYSYTASFAVALSARPIMTVGRIWADGKLLRGAAGDWKAQTGFRLHTGGEAQAVDPLIASAEGGALTPAHRGVAYAVFEDLELADYGNRIPSLTFEVVADAGPVAAGAIVESLTDGAVRAGEAGTEIGGFSAYGGSMRGVIEPLVQAAGAWPEAADGLSLRLGEGVTREVADAGIDGTPGGRGQRAIAAADTAPREVTISHYDPARDYQAGLQRASRPGAGHREERIELPAALPAGTAKHLATAMLMRSDVERERRTVAAGWGALDIAPGARVRIADEPGQWRVTGWSLEDMAVSLDLLRIAPAALPVSATPGRVLGAPDEQAGETILHAFELPHLTEGLPAERRLSIAACGTQPGWRRAALAISLDDGARWTAAGMTAGPATIGVIESLPAAVDPALEDRRSVLIVELAHAGMTLTDADMAALDAGANLALVGNELIQFGDATPLGENRWRLSRLWRGRRATEAAIGTAAVGDRFVAISPDTLVQATLPAGAPGPALVMASAASDGDGVQTSAALSGVSLASPSPVALRATRLADGDWRLDWTRRSRLGWRWIDGADAPLGEEAERYRIRFIPALGAPLEEEVAVANIPVPAELSVSGPLTIEVRQAGDHGLSPPATLTIQSIEE